MKLSSNLMFSLVALASNGVSATTGALRGGNSDAIRVLTPVEYSITSCSPIPPIPDNICDDSVAYSATSPTSFGIGYALLCYEDQDNGLYKYVYGFKDCRGDNPSPSLSHWHVILDSDCATVESVSCTFDGEGPFDGELDLGVGDPCRDVLDRTNNGWESVNPLNNDQKNIAKCNDETESESVHSGTLTLLVSGVTDPDGGTVLVQTKAGGDKGKSGNKNNNGNSDNGNNGQNQEFACEEPKKNIIGPICSTGSTCSCEEEDSLVLKPSPDTDNTVSSDCDRNDYSPSSDWTAYSSCDSSVTVTHSDDCTDDKVGGITIDREWTATDCAGKFVSDDETIEVNDFCDATISDASSEVPVEVNIHMENIRNMENDAIGLEVKVSVVDSEVYTGDIRGIFLQLVDTAVENVKVITETAPVTSFMVGLDSIDRLSNDVNMRGGGVLYDVGIEIGRMGIGKGDDYQTATVVIENISTDDVVGKVGVRLTSVGRIGSSRNGSSKMSGDVTCCRATCPTDRQSEQ
ncbi:hypothetical protein IV203_028398 [Nitzschia inconspicua]|uniref:Uncharacterized protein n=1 Tax=Nitzschia inconspicua TaxID=303405 RepID=A0A9K3PNN2_9STRA|nr:hypothetical protein IV203_007677 [Nitzschia inconspicua]KAG7365728.1 hypothetical protein IV203_028398 [Nitzschia inconspicua]